MSLPVRQLSKNGPKVTAMGIGLMGLSGFYGTVKPDETRFSFLDACYELGELHWDSADLYMDSEELLGKWFKRNPGKRDDIFLATKFGIQILPDGKRQFNNSREYCHERLERSLRLLGVPFVDLYYCHRMDGKTPIEKTIGYMLEKKNEGKIKYLGLSECSSETLRRAHKVHPITAVQIEYSPFSLDIENPKVDLLNTCRELGVAVVAYSPLGRGILAGAIKSRDDLEPGDFRLNHPRWSEENFGNNIKLTEKIHALAQKKKVTASQLTLAWLLAQGQDIIPIPGTTKIERLKENLEAFNIKLTKEEEQDIRQAAENAEVRGPRYPNNIGAFGDTPSLSDS